MSRQPPAAALAVALALVALASCAPPPRPGAALDALASRYGARRARREAMLRALTTQLVVRIDGRATGRLPALEASVALAAPDRLRLRAGALLGVALDVLCARDSVFAWVPSQDLAFVAPAESLGVTAPAAYLARALGATWDPPPQAWRTASADSDGWQLAWREGADSVALEVGGDGLPRSAWLGRAGAGVRVRYEGWAGVRGEDLPARWRLEDDTGWARVRVDAEGTEARRRARAAWFEARHAAPGRTLGWVDLRTLLAGKEPR